MFCFAPIALRAMVDFKMCAARNMCPTRARRAGGSRAIARLRARTLRGLQVRTIASHAWDAQTQRQNAKNVFRRNLWRIMVIMFNFAARNST